MSCGLAKGISTEEGREASHRLGGQAAGPGQSVMALLAHDAIDDQQHDRTEDGDQEAADIEAGYVTKP